MERRISVLQMVDLVKNNWPEASKPEADVVVAVLRLNDIIRGETDKVLKNHGLTTGGFEVLYALRVSGRTRQMTPSDLYRAVLMTSGGMTKILTTLERLGFVERVSNPDDKRSSLVKITSAGEQKVEQVTSDIVELDQSYFDGRLDRDEVENLRTVILDVVNRIETTYRPRLR